MAKIPYALSQSSKSSTPTYHTPTLMPRSTMSKSHRQALLRYASSFVCGGADYQRLQLSFVGQIRNISTQTTNITYKLDDGTGTVEVKQWIDADAASDMSDPSAPSKPKLVVNEWARVWGRLKAFNDRRHVGAHVIRPIENKMDISYHLLEATYVHLYFTRGDPSQFTNPGGQQAADAQGQQDGGYGVGDSLEMYGRQMPNVSVNARKVYSVLRNSPQNNEGLHVQNVAASLGLGIQEVMKAGDDLLGHSLIYTTVDDDTWAII